jgi:hypothetical protein
MKYKKEIDKLRKNQKLIADNIKLVEDDLMFYDEQTKLNELLEEHRYYNYLFKDVGRLINERQPWWRRKLGLLY